MRSVIDAQFSGQISFFILLYSILSAFVNWENLRAKINFKYIQIYQLKSGIEIGPFMCSKNRLPQEPSWLPRLSGTISALRGSGLKPHETVSPVYAAAIETCFISHCC